MLKEMIIKISVFLCALLMITKSTSANFDINPTGQNPRQLKITGGTHLAGGKHPWPAIMKINLVPTFIYPVSEFDVRGLINGKQNLANAITVEELQNLPELLYCTVDRDHPISAGEIEKVILPGLRKPAEWDLLIPGGYLFPILDQNIRIHQLMEKDLIGLVCAAWSDDVHVYIRSGFRSYAEQQMALDKVSGDTRLVEPPGQSQHHTGLAVDFSTPENQHALGAQSMFSDTKAGLWLNENAWKFGFINAYLDGHDNILPEAESHHYVYVGRIIAGLYMGLRQQGWEGDIFELQNRIQAIASME